MKSLRVRIFAFIASIILIFGGAVMLLNQTCLSVFYMWHCNRTLKSSVSQIGALMPETLTYNTQAFSVLEESSGIEIVLYTTDSNVVYATALGDFDPQVNSPGWLRSRAAEITDITIHSQSYDSELSRYEVQKSKDGSVTYLAYRSFLKGDYWVLVRMNAVILENSADVANTFMTMTVFLLLLIALIGSLWIAGYLSRPIREMNAATLAMSRFDFSHKVSVKGKDEIAQLASSINVMSDNTSALLKELQEKNDRLEKEVQQEQKLVENQKDFVSNVSHELKTPIAIIQGYAEGLRLNVADDPERRQMYCEIIESEAYKMDKLVKQLLELSRLESGQTPLHEDLFNLTDMMLETVDRIASITDDVTVIGRFDDRPRMAWGDEMRLGEVLQNYLNNAIAHAKGEKLVAVAVSPTETGYRVSVFNTGDHIAEDMKEKVWISFYRGDKSRSRENGNCGLGLSIASTIMRQHGEACGVDNVEGGVVFWFDVKRYDEEER